MDIFRRAVSAVFVLMFLATVPQAHAGNVRPVLFGVAGSEKGLAGLQAIYLTKHIEERLPKQFLVQKRFDASGPNEVMLLEKVRHGHMDMAILGDAVIDAAPRLSLFRIPWLFANREHVQQSLYAGLEDEIRTYVEDALNVVVIGVYDNAFHQIRASKAISTPQDFRHLKILVNSGREMRDLMRSFGAIPQKMMAEQVEGAVSHGLVDSIDGDLSTLARLPLGQKLSEISLTQHVYEPAFFIASRQFWNSLSDGQRAAMTNLGVDFSDTADHLAVNYGKAVRKSLPKDITVKRVSAEPFAKITSTYRKAYEEKFGREWLDIVDIGRENTPQE